MCSNPTMEEQCPVDTGCNSCGVGQSAGVPEICITQECSQPNENNPCCCEQPVVNCVPVIQECPPDLPQCPPEVQCNPEPVCTQNLRYIQPKPAQSCKPISCFKQPEVVMECDTIYKKSYLCIDAQMAACCRPNPVKPTNQIHNSCAKMSTETVTSLSYPGHCNVPAAKSIRPCAPSLLGQGPMQALTTQKHDFVPKPFCKRPLIIPPDSMQKTCCGLDNLTTARLSYMPPNMACFSRAESFRPTVCYQAPQIPMDINTTQKMSYQPVCPKTKEIYPWATKPCYQLPNLPMERETTYKMSYIPNQCNVRSQPIYPMVNSKILTANTCFDNKTVYKESYFQGCGERATPIYPQSQLHVPCNEKMCTSTVYQGTYQGHCNVARRQPIRPCPPSLLGQGPMQDLTTQKHDYVPKPFSKRNLIMPTSLLPKTCAGLENQTTSRLSYMAPNMECFSRAISCRPVATYSPPCVPMDINTTQKMSFLPVCPPQKECYPWAQRARYCPPGVPMDTATTQQLSFMPPGKFVEESGYMCGYPPCCQNNVSCFPKAAIVR